MAKGRKRIPSRIIELTGGTKRTHKKPAGEKEPKPPLKLPSCPKHLDEHARKEWKRVSKILHSVGLLTGLDRAVLADYCDAYSQWAQSTTKAQEQGLVFMSKAGVPVLNPYYKISREASDRMKKSGVLLGLSPSSRAGLKVEKPKKENSAEDFLSLCKKENDRT
jgi:P27 family predicted phage terminase small subunit